MTVASEITRIKTNIENAYNSASEKGATLPDVQNSDNLATCISSITGGGSGGSSSKYGISIDDILETLEKLISLHIVELETNNGTRYLLHKIKAIEAAVTFRLIERLIHNEDGFGCGEFFALTQY